MNVQQNILAADRDQIEQFVGALFRYVTEGTFVSLRAFDDHNRGAGPFAITPVTIDAGGLSALTDAATGLANRCANAHAAIVFCPPVATFLNADDAKERSVAEGLALSVECDATPTAAREMLEAILGRATVVVSSGGEWTDPETGEVQDKLHLHWRLTEPTRTPEDHAALKQARRMATELTGSDATNVPLVHPIRWPGSWHRKGEPKMTRIAALHDAAEIELQDALDALKEALGDTATSAPATATGGLQIDTGEGYPRKTPDEYASLLAACARDGWKHHAVVRLAASLAAQGCTEAFTAGVIRHHCSVWDNGVEKAIATGFEKYRRAGAGTVGLDPVDPTPLIRDMPEAGPYPVAALGALREPAEALASVTEAPVALCAASTLAAAALAAQGHRNAETLSGTAPASLFLLTVAESGERKSTADRLAMRGVRDFEADLCTDYDIERDLWRDAHEMWKASRARILADKKADAASKRADLKALGPEPSAPLKPHIVASAPTIEGITKHLPELRASLGVMTEEGGALIGGHSMKAENRLATCATFSAMWDGAPLDRWRAGDGVESYTGRRFSAHILVQPVAAEALLSDPMANGQGLLARFLTCRPASRIGSRLRMERDARAEAQIGSFAARIRALLSRDLPLADGRRNELAPPVLPLSVEARAVLTDFAREVERAQGPGGPFEDARAFASKTAEHAARLAAVLTVFADPDAPEVTGATMAGATEIATFYATEAARLADAAVIPPDVADAERMRKWLLGSWSEPYISARAAAQRGPFKVTDRTRKALQRLEAHGWLIEANGEMVEGKARREAWRIVRKVQP